MDFHAVFWLMAFGAVVLLVALLVALKRIGPSERLVILQGGKARKVSGPGLVFILPLIQQGKKVDVGERTRKLSSSLASSLANNTGMPDLYRGCVRYAIVDPAKSLSIDNVDDAVFERANKILVGEFAGLTIEQALCRRGAFAARMQTLLHARTITFGVKIIALELTALPAHEQAVRNLDYLIYRQTHDIYSFVTFLV